MLRDVAAASETAPWLFPWALALTAIAGLAGGASRENAIPLAVVELAAIPAAALAVARLVDLRRFDPGMILLGLAILVPLVQLVPLPPALWMAAPGHDVLAQALTVLGEAPRWAPLSLFPGATLDAVLALLPPAALFLATAGLSRERRRSLAALWLAVGMAGLLLGAVQMSEPSGGPAYLYATTNIGSLVGQFANRNHQAGFLLALIPLAAAVAVGGRHRPPPGGRSAPAEAPGAWTPMLAAVFALSALVALGVVRSRAGVLLAAPAILGALAVLARSGMSRRGLALAAAGALAVILAVVLFALTPILARFGAPLSEEARFAAWPTVVSVARSFTPWGAGAGAFEPVFLAAEPLDMLGPTFLNHAHDDYLEIWLETGVFGVALVVAFFAWLGIASWRAWRARRGALAQAAGVAALLVLLQSLVDYPLRTETIACLFAFACGCLVAPDPERRAPRP
jgi:O-antigen ligase